MLLIGLKIGHMLGGRGLYKAMGVQFQKGKKRTGDNQ